MLALESAQEQARLFTDFQIVELCALSELTALFAGPTLAPLPAHWRDLAVTKHMQTHKGLEARAMQHDKTQAHARGRKNNSKNGLTSFAVITLLKTFVSPFTTTSLFVMV